MFNYPCIKYIIAVYEEAITMQNKGLPPGEPAVEAVRVAAVQVRGHASRNQKLKTRFSNLAPELSATWSPIWKGSTQTGQLPLFSSDTTLVSKALEVE